MCPGENTEAAIIRRSQMVLEGWRVWQASSDKVEGHDANGNKCLKKNVYFFNFIPS